MNCKHLRISQLQVGTAQIGNCRYKLTGEDKAQEVHAKLVELGFEKRGTPGLQCPFYPHGTYSACPWYTRDLEQEDPADVLPRQHRQ